MTELLAYQTAPRENQAAMWNSPSPTSPRFTSTFTVDVGASRSQGSLKLALFNKNGALIGEELKTQVARKPVANGQAFTEAIFSKIKELIGKHSQFDFNADPITEVVLALPSAIRTHQGSAYIDVFPNIKNAAKEALSNIHFKPLFEKLNTLAQTQFKAPKMLVVNDMMGGGAQVAQQLLALGRLNKGDGALFIMTGGGMGAVHIKHHSNKILITAQEMGNTQPLANGLTYEKAGASLAGLIKPFVRNVVSTSKLTQNTLITNKEVRAAFKKAGDDRGKLITNFETAIKYLPALTEKQHYDAAYEATFKYIDQVAAVMGQYRGSLQTQTVVLGGPIATGLKDLYQSKEHYFTSLDNARLEKHWKKISSNDQKKINQLIQEYSHPFDKAIIKRLAIAFSNSHMLSLLFNSDQTQPIFKLITSMEIQSNAKGAALLKDAKETGTAEMATSQLEIPIKKLKTT